MQRPLAQVADRSASRDGAACSEAMRPVCRSAGKACGRGSVNRSTSAHQGHQRVDDQHSGQTVACRRTGPATAAPARASARPAAGADRCAEVRQRPAAKQRRRSGQSASKTQPAPAMQPQRQRARRDQTAQDRRCRFTAAAPPPSGSARCSSSSTFCPSTSASAVRITRCRRAGRAICTTSSGTA